MQNHHSLWTALLYSLLFSHYTFAADFTIINGQTEVTRQTLLENETGTIEAGGQLNTAGTAVDA